MNKTLKVLVVCSFDLAEANEKAARFRKQNKYVVWCLSDPLYRLPQNVEAAVAVCDARQESAWREFAKRQHCDVVMNWFGLEG